MSSDQLLAVLQVVIQLLAAASSNAAYQAIINVIQKFLPFIVSAEQAIYQSFKNVIDDLSGNPNLTADQVQVMLQAKAAMDARVDADIDRTLGTSGSN